MSLRELCGVAKLCASDQAVAALRHDGRVVAWGSAEHGGAVGDLTEAEISSSLLKIEDFKRNL